MEKQGKKLNYSSIFSNFHIRLYSKAHPLITHTVIISFINLFLMHLRASFPLFHHPTTILSNHHILIRLHQQVQHSGNLDSKSIFKRNNFVGFRMKKGNDDCCIIARVHKLLRRPFLLLSSLSNHSKQFHPKILSRCVSRWFNLLTFALISRANQSVVNNIINNKTESVRGVEARGIFI